MFVLQPSYTHWPECTPASPDENSTTASHLLSSPDSTYTLESPGVATTTTKTAQQKPIIKPDEQKEKPSTTTSGGEISNSSSNTTECKAITAATNGQLYKTRLCYYFAQGKCSWGASCHHAHSLAELKPKPNLTKTSLCPLLETCNRVGCSYAHSRDELRSTDSFAKTKVCFGSCENCRFGGNCRYAHSVNELRTVRPLPQKVMFGGGGPKKKDSTSDAAAAAVALAATAASSSSRNFGIRYGYARTAFDPSLYGPGYMALQGGDRIAVVRNGILADSFGEQTGWQYGKNFTQHLVGWFPTSYVSGLGLECHEVLPPVMPSVVGSQYPMTYQ